MLVSLKVEDVVSGIFGPAMARAVHESTCSKWSDVSVSPLRMTFSRQITSFVLLFAWCFATVHQWTAHAGEGSFEVSSEEHAHDWHGHHHDDDHDDGGHHEDEDQPAEKSHHHHALGVTTRVVAFQDLTIAAPMTEILWDAIVKALSSAGPEAPELEITGSPPDVRCSGFLFVIRTAHPVRGPSLVA